MIIQELFQGLVGEYCIARNTIKCLFLKDIGLVSISVCFIQRHFQFFFNMYALT